MPEATEEKMPIAAFTLMVDTKPGKMLFASLGNVKPNVRAASAYSNGTIQALMWVRRRL